MDLGSSGYATASRAVVVWLWVVAGMIVVMVVLGGITRLTGSGLSIVEWRPLMGAIPPLDDAGWHEVFGKYQLSPQYREVNHWMTLADFKAIFFWEYVHRLWGRLIGVAYLGPWLYFLARRRLSGRLARHAFVPFVLGGLQGALGWFMVVSGLQDMPAVSHYRLAAHLALALAVACWVVWLALDIHVARAARALRDDPPRMAEVDRAPSPLRTTARVAVALFVLVAAQVLYGAFMAGTRAGYLYTTFPTMNGRWFPPQAFAYEPGWRNLLESPFGIHFYHRMLGWLVAAAVFAFSAWTWRQAHTARARIATRALPLLVVVQIGLGWITVAYRVPVWSAALHQLVGTLLLGASLLAVHAFRLPRPVRRRAASAAAGG